jgi:hypothetical protein
MGVDLIGREHGLIEVQVAAAGAPGCTAGAHMGYTANVIDRAIRIAASRRTVTAVIIPSDVQELDYSPPVHAFKMVPSSLDQT